MKSIFLIFIFFSYPLLAQTVYLQHEVEKQAEPTGGLLYLNQFISTNAQIPFQSSIHGLNGRVYVKGIIEPDGSMSNLEISRGMDSLSNQEALRVMSLYKAWKPAVLKGEKVRQLMVYPMTFKADTTAGYDSTKKALVQDLDDGFYPTANPRKVEYRRTLPVDDKGYINGDLLYEQLKGGKWKAFLNIPYEKKEIWYKFRNEPDSVKAYHVMARDKNQASHVPEAIFHTNGKLLSFTKYNEQGKASFKKDYNKNGMLVEMHIISDSIDTELKWHDNGQIRSVLETIAPKPMGTEKRNYINAWDRSGSQLVKDGEGYLKSVEFTYDGQLLVEEGQVKAGKKEGQWRGKWADSTLHYEERYKNGTLTEGYAFHGTVKSSYHEAMKQPAFRGGVNEFYKFLGENIQYPAEASRRGIAGRVLLSFVVCEDGSLCDYKVESGMGYGMDDEALRVVKKMNGKWEPGSVRGKNVRVKYNLPINFQQN